MEKKRRRFEALRWKGTLAEASKVLRRTVAGVLALMCVTLAFTQWGFIGFQFANGGAAYLIFLLVPVAISAMLLGTLAGAGMGLFAGAELYLHALLMPLDYYELTFVTPVTSIVIMCLCGLLLGALFAAVLRSGKQGWQRMALVACACLVASIVYSAGFALSTIALMAYDMVTSAGLHPSGEQLAAIQAEAVDAALHAGDANFQVFGDTIIMALASVLALVAAERGGREVGGAGLRQIFSARLAAVVLVAFMVVSTTSYTTISGRMLRTSADDMRSEVKYLLGQIERTADYNGLVVQALVEAGVDMTHGSAGELLSGGMLASLVDGYTEDEDGLVVTAVGKYVTSVDTDRLDVRDDTVLSDFFDEKILEAADRSAADGTIERVIYLAPNRYSDLVDVRVPLAGSGDLAELETLQVGYLEAVEHDHYWAIMVRPASMVFDGRGLVVMWVTLSSLVLLLAVYALVRQLLDYMVARQIDATNAVLARITDGDLEARIVPEGTREFWDLAAGINVTVDALKGWIAEAESRMDAELATAKAIQESALPSIFPPFPDIRRFDIFASMNAAKEVGGDFYDFFLVGDDCGPDAGRLAFVMADVSGKGVPAALFMMKAKTQIRDYLESGMELGEAVENANRQLCDGNDAGMFVTAWVGVLDYATGHIDYVNAGHNPPLLWHAGSWEWVRQRSGLPLGLFDGLPYAAHSLECEVGDQLLLYTDGVTEAFSVSEEQYGEERLLALANEGFDLHPRELVGQVRASVAAHAEGAEQSDDITILALEVGVPPEEKAQLVVEASIEALAQVNDFVHAELDRRLCPVRVQNQIDIAVEEMFVNVCSYAYEGMGAEVERTARITYSYSADPVSLTIEIIDAGVPFDPLAKPDAKRADEYGGIAEIPIGGLGILMTKRNVDEMRYERVGNLNVVTLVKTW